MTNPNDLQSYNQIVLYIARVQDSKNQYSFHPATQPISAAEPTLTIIPSLEIYLEPIAISLMS